MQNADDIQKPIASSAATVQSAHVYVKTVMIGNRQITQSVYRQIPEESAASLLYGMVCLDRGLSLDHLAALPWGWVNFHTEACPAQSHLHVLCEKNGLICKVVLCAPTERAKDRFQRAMADANDNKISVDESWSQFEQVYETVLNLGQIYIAI